MPHQRQQQTQSKTLLSHRTALAVAVHGILFSLSLLMSFALAFNFHFRQSWFADLFLPVLPFTIIIKIAVFGLLKQYRGSWRYVGLRDLFGVVKASHVSAFVFVVCYYLAENLFYRWMNRPFLILPDGTTMPAMIFILDWLMTIAVVSSARIGVRFYHEELRPSAAGSASRLLIVGAGDAGESVLREILRMPEERYQVVGFLDDDQNKRGNRIHGVEVIGSPDDIRTICARLGIEEVLIAMPTAPQRRIRGIIEKCQGTNLRFRTVPAVADLIEGKVRVSQIRDVDIEDLLGREAVKLDTDNIAEYIRGRTVIVTGAGGSIGSEMCRQISPFKPQCLLLLEQAENNLFHIDRELRRQHSDLKIIPVIADVFDSGRLDYIFSKYKPHAVFHAAAHKHVPMMEMNPGEAVKNNIVGTRNLADAAMKSGVDKFVMISTDKAVNPTSVMGCTKRVAEMYVQQLSSRGQTQFVTVRFGNVLGSSGSVVPIFKEQILRGGPVTVTHPEMRRYFMTIPEAAQLVLQAGSMGHGGEIFLLDMGEPVKIVDLARDLITLTGLRPGDDIEIAFTGMRPGEKLFEELSIEGEDVSRTAHPKIGIMKKRTEKWDSILNGIDKLVQLALANDTIGVRKTLAEVVPEYAPPNGFNDPIDSVEPSAMTNLPSPAKS